MAKRILVPLDQSLVASVMLVRPGRRGL